jgi:iron complex transport system ATP-binding protein
MGMMRTEPRLTARDITVEIGGKRLLDGVSLSVAPGEVVALVGPNGAGKSTLLKVLAGDLAPNEGAVVIESRPIETCSTRELARMRSVLPQQTVLQFAFTAREVVEMGRSPHRGMHGDDLAVVDASLARTETIHLAERIYPTLSGGEQGRVTLARVLAQECPVLLLDEPTASLDIRHQQMVMEVARELAGQGASIVAVLHDLNLAASHADRVAVLSRGRLVANGTPWATMTEELLSEVFAHPITVGRHPVHDCPLVMPLPGSAGTPARQATRPAPGE